MNRSGLLLALSFLQVLSSCLAASSPLSSTPNGNSPSVLVSPTNPSASSNQTTILTNPYRYYVPDTTVAIDFYEYRGMSDMVRTDVLMCVIEGLSKIFGHGFDEPVPGISTFYYQTHAFIHIQDLNPTPGRGHTYGDMAATLRGVGEWMTANDYFKQLEFQIWTVTPDGQQTKIGSGGVGR